MSKWQIVSSILTVFISLGISPIPYSFLCFLSILLYTDKILYHDYLDCMGFKQNKIHLINSELLIQNSGWVYFFLK